MVTDYEEQEISKPYPKFIQQLWLEDRHCRCCGKPTRLLKTNGGALPPDTATIEHKYPRGHPLRKVAAHVRTLYCYSCNCLSNEYFRQNKQLYDYTKSYEYRMLLDRHRAAKKRGYCVSTKRALIPIA